MIYQFIMRMIEMKVIGITGWPGAGKTTVAEFARKFGYFPLSIGNLIREMVKKEKWDPSDLIGFGEHCRNKYGEGYFIKIIIKKIKEGKNKKYTIDDIRLLIEDKLLRKEFEDEYKFIGVAAEQDARFKRLFDRKRPDDESPEEKENRELEQYQIPKLIEIADILIDNNGSIKDLEDNVGKILKGLK